MEIKSIPKNYCYKSKIKDGMILKLFKYKLKNNPKYLIILFVKSKILNKELFSQYPVFIK